MKDSGDDKKNKEINIIKNQNRNQTQQYNERKGLK